MEETVMLIALALFTLLAAVCSIVFNKLRLPPLIGYIIAGIILVNILFSRQSEDAVAAEEEIISIMKHMGLVMLMFCIGLEINIKKIRKQGSFAILVAAIQLPLVVLGGYIGGTLLGYDMTQSIVLGAILSGSSTAVVMAVLKSQGKLDREHVEMLVLITIMEDIGQVIILSMITPLMANYAAGAAGAMDVNDIVVLIVKILAFMIVSILVGLRIVPRVINWISDNVSDEILTITSVGLAFGMALLASAAGLSSAVGAFLMGMMVASSRKARSINEKIEPMRDLFMAIFFISIGTEVFPAAMLADNIGTILIFLMMFICLKTATVFLAYWVGNESSRNGFISATSLCAMGEFAFIIAAEALGRGVIGDDFYTSVIGAALLSMIVLPVMGRYTGALWDRAAESCPRRLYHACCELNGARTRLYERLSVAPARSQRAFARRMAHAYYNILFIAAIEIAFYFLLPALSDWLYDSFGVSRYLWIIAVLALNLMALTVPTFYLMSNVKFLDEIIVSGARRIASREGVETDGSDRYERFLRINTSMMVAAVDFSIVLLVPNALPIPWWYYLAVFALMVLAMAAARLRRRGAEEQGTSSDDGTDVRGRRRRSGEHGLRVSGVPALPIRIHELRQPHVMPRCRPVRRACDAAPRVQGPGRSGRCACGSGPAMR